MKKILIALIVLLLVAGVLLAAYCRLTGSCLVTYTPGKPSWTPQNALRLPVQVCPALPENLELPALRKALQESLAFFSQQPAKNFQFGEHLYSGQELFDTYQQLLEFLQKSPSLTQVHEYLCSRFLFFPSAAETVLFTGYYEPLLHGSLEKDERFRYPLYAVPDDLIRVHVSSLPLVDSSELPVGFPTLRGRVVDRSLVPYFTRTEIDSDEALAGRKLELLWVHDDVDRFFLQIQGSGIVQLNDGTTVRVGYGDKNGHPYRPIGKLLIEEEKIPRAEMSMQRLKQYLRDHPEDADRIMAYNPSYVFFRLLDGAGPIGSIGRPLTAMHSIATDNALFPAGALALIDVSLPHESSGDPRRFLVLNQDTGGAIRGPGRVDLFTGNGKQAENVAGHLNSKGGIFFLAPLNN